MDLLLRRLVWHTRHGDVAGDLRLFRGRIVETGRGLAPRRRERVLELAGCRALPGLINGHDHLSLNLLPHLGDPPYASLYRFAEEIYRPERSPIREILRVPIRDRLLWGGYKNLIAGVTSVVHHDPLPRGFFVRDLLARACGGGFPVRVHRRFAWSHSLRYGDDPAAAHARSGRRPFIIHAAEGVDEECRGEVDRLYELGMLAANTVLVHGVALTPDQCRRLARSGAGLVWCPSSNLRLFGRTAPIERLAGSVPLALGTDSTLTGAPTLLDEARAAAATGLASGEEILEMVSVGAARVFGLTDRGRIGVGAAADLVVMPDTGGAAATLLGATPADLVLVTVAGRPRLARPEVAETLELGTANAALAGSPPVRSTAHAEPVWLDGDPGALKARIEETAGHRALAGNPLWGILEARAAVSPALR